MSNGHTLGNIYCVGYIRGLCGIDNVDEDKAIEWCNDQLQDSPRENIPAQVEKIDRMIQGMTNMIGSASFCKFFKKKVYEQSLEIEAEGLWGLAFIALVVVALSLMDGPLPLGEAAAMGIVGEGFIKEDL